MGWVGVVDDVTAELLPQLHIFLWQRKNCVRQPHCSGISMNVKNHIDETRKTQLSTEIYWHHKHAYCLSLRCQLAFDAEFVCTQLRHALVHVQYVVRYRTECCKSEMKYQKRFIYFFAFGKADKRIRTKTNKAIKHQSILLRDLNEVLDANATEALNVCIHRWNFVHEHE